MLASTPASSHSTRETQDLFLDSRVPLRVGWLAENDLLVEAAESLGYTFKVVDDKVQDVGAAGVRATVDGVELLLQWDDHLLFTVSQLLELGFEPGEFSLGALARISERLR